MPFILTLAASLMGWGRSAFAWIKTLPWYVLALAACAMMIVWQHHGEVSKDARIAALNATLAQVKEAQAQATAIAQQALRHQEAQSKANATIGQQNENAKLAAAQSAVDDLRNERDRLLAQTIANHASDPVAPGQGIRPDIPATMPADSQLSLSEADVRSCASATAYAIAAHDWALSLNSTTP